MYLWHRKPPGDCTILPVGTVDTLITIFLDTQGAIYPVGFILLLLFFTSISRYVTFYAGLRAAAVNCSQIWVHWTKHEQVRFQKKKIVNFFLICLRVTIYLKKLPMLHNLRAYAISYRNCKWLEGSMWRWKFWVCGYCKDWKKKW